MNRSLSLIAATVLAAGALASAAPAAAQVAQDQGSSHTIVVAKDKSAAFRLDYPASEIVVAQPDTLQLVATTDRSFYVRGKALGVTNILIYDMEHHLAQVVDVRVGYDVESLQSDLHTALPGEQITASNFAALQSRRTEDLCAATLSLVGETIGIVASLCARELNCRERIVMVGKVSRNRYIRRTLELVGKLYQTTFLFPENPKLYILVRQSGFSR